MPLRSLVISESYYQCLFRKNEQKKDSNPLSFHSKSVCDLLTFFIFQILNFCTNLLSNVFQILHSFTQTRTSSAIGFVIKLVCIHFDGCNQSLEFFEFFHFS